jgi:O-antigen ligase/tetratricopeptide (TPR) repeat protein
MAKKIPVTAQKTTVTPSRPTAKKSFRFDLSSVVPLLACLLYFVVHFLPDFGGYDAMGAQWFYMVALDFAVIIFILARNDYYAVSSASIFKNTFSKLYLSFFALAGISIFTAINPTEGWVCYVRLISTIVAYFNISILLKGRKDLIKILAQVLGLILLFESYQTINQFLNGITSGTPLEELIMSIKGYAGNKNIFAAGLVVKVPFVLYGIHSFKRWGKILNMVIFVFASLAIFIMNARATYLSLFLILLMYFAFCVILYLKEKKLEQSLYRIGFIFIPLIIAYFVSQIQLTTAVGLQDDKAGKDFGTVNERLLSVTKTDDESNQVRFRLWQHAIDYTKHHPLMGCGIGNWKIASIPYQRTITNDLYVPIHAHNDFLEVFAELGIPGGLLYLAIFVCIAVLTFKTFYSKAEEDTKMIAVFSLMAFAAYAVDAMFNFPLERPISQVFFAFITAVNVGAYITGRDEQGDEKPVAAKAGIYKTLFAFIAMLFLVPSLYVTWLTYKSLIVQRSVLGDLNNEPLKLDWKVIVPSFPSIPNLSATAQPIDAIKGRYLYEVGKEKYPEALALLDKGRKANPVIGYAEFLKAGIYYRMGKYDSAARNAKIAFNLRPKAKTYFQTLVAVLAQMRDTAGIKTAFIEFDHYRHWAYGYNLYLLAMLNAGARDTHYLMLMADSAIKMFPHEDEIKDVMIRKQEINSRALQMAMANKTPGAQVDYAAAQRYYAAGTVAFGTGVPGKDDLEKAAENFLKSFSLNPGDFTAVENAAICFFNMKQWDKSIKYFDKELAMKLSNNGKPEYFKGVALINLGKKDDGCKYMQAASDKGWKAADAILKSHCGKG